jgi:glycosyltransferase involved in cell wall biosynthesis
MKTSLSVLVPVYNEDYLVYESLQRLKVLETSPHLERIEVIVVDDCSTGSSPQVIERFKKETESAHNSKIQWKIL